MSIELRPLGVACNLSCHYCYQNPQRDAGNQRASYDLEKMKAETVRVGGPFTLFGGEPLIMPFDDLENLFAWGLEKFGSSAIQTNGILIEDRHIEAFRRYKVSVGISIDGPGELNDARWHRELDKTRRSTALVEAAIERLCREYRPPGLIITLHKGNATANKLPRMTEWIRRLHSVGIKSIRLHLLEVDHQSVRDSLALSSRENIEAILALAEVQESLPGMRMDLFADMEHLLRGDDSKVGCIWRACDPYTTDAVRGIEGNGQSSNCGRTNKEGVDFIKANAPGFERYLALYRTPQSENGCAGCRFFLMCKGQCPGTSIDGDWRNRTEHCAEWKHLFGVIERRMILAGDHPLTIQPVRFELERRMIEAWARGTNPSISRTLSAWRKRVADSAARTSAPSSAMAPVVQKPVVRPKPRARISWVSERARIAWQGRLQRIHSASEDLTVHSAAMIVGERCAARLVSASGIDRVRNLATTRGLASAVLPAEALPTGICSTMTPEPAGVVLVGRPAVVALAREQWEERCLGAFHPLLDIPGCCLRHGAESKHPGMLPAPPGTSRLPQGIAAHPLLAPLGVAGTAVLPCRLDCGAALMAVRQWLECASTHGFVYEAKWLAECFGWAMSHSELHGVAEVKSPLFKMCFQTPFDLGPRQILRPGSVAVAEGARGLSFPYALPLRQPRSLQLEAAL